MNRRLNDWMGSFIGERFSPDKKRYAPFPIATVFFGHVLATALIGSLFLHVDVFRWAHPWLKPIVNWIPNVSETAELTPDPVFTELFLATSLLFALGMVAFLLIFARKRDHSTSYRHRGEKPLHLVLLTLVAVGMVFASWLIPYASAIEFSGGKAHALFHLATSSNLGVVFVLNYLVVGTPLLFGVLVLAQVFCTDALRHPLASRNFGEKKSR